MLAQPGCRARGNGTEATDRPRPGRRVLLHVLLAGVVALPLAPARARDGDPLTLFVQETVTWDDNVLRLPKTAPAGRTGDAPARGDTYFTTSAGVGFDVPASRQRFVGTLSVNDSRYQRYTGLDFTGHDARVAWQWRAGDALAGTLAYSDVAAPQSFAGIQERASDVLRTQQVLASAGFPAEGRWRLEAAANWLRQRNGNEINRFDNIDVLRGELALRHLPRPDEFVGLFVRGEDGRYPERAAVAVPALADAYRQYEAGVEFAWVPSGRSRLAGRAAYASRRWDDAPGRDWEGAVGRLQYDWDTGGGLALSAIARREINPYETLKATFTRIDGVTLVPLWRASPRIDVSATLDYSQRNYLGAPQLACGVAPGWSDHLTSATLALAWRPAPGVTVQLGAQYQACASGVPVASYRAGIASLGLAVRL